MSFYFTSNGSNKLFGLVYCTCDSHAPISKAKKNSVKHTQKYITFYAKR